jgi:hypothetical protein
MVTRVGRHHRFPPAPPTCRTWPPAFRVGGHFNFVRYPGAMEFSIDLISMAIGAALGLILRKEYLVKLGGVFRGRTRP